jgi:hypothetical protein
VACDRRVTGTIQFTIPSDPVSSKVVPEVVDFEIDSERELLISQCPTGLEKHSCGASDCYTHPQFMCFNKQLFHRYINKVSPLLQYTFTIYTCINIKSVSPFTRHYK